MTTTKEASTFQTDLLPISRHIVPTNPPAGCAHYLAGVSAATAADLVGGGLRRLLSESVGNRPLEPLSAEALKRGFTFPRTVIAAGGGGGAGAGAAAVAMAAAGGAMAQQRARQRALEAAERQAAAARAQQAAREAAQRAADQHVRMKREAEASAASSKRARLNAANAFLDPAVLAAGQLHTTVGDTVTFGGGMGMNMAPVDPAAAAAAAKEAERVKADEAAMKVLLDGLVGLRFAEGGVPWGNPFTTVFTRKNVAELGVPDYFKIVVKAMDLTTIGKQLRRGTYRGQWQLLIADVKLVRDNALAFNRPGDAVFRFANELWEHFTKQIAALEEQKAVEKAARKAARKADKAARKAAEAVAAAGGVSGSGAGAVPAAAAPAPPAR